MGIANSKLLSGLGSVRAVATEHMSVTNEGDVAMHDIKQAADGLESLLCNVHDRIAALAIAAATLNASIVSSGWLIEVSPTGGIQCSYTPSVSMRVGIAKGYFDSAGVN